MKLAVDRRAATAVPVVAALPGPPPLVVAVGLAVESRMLSVAVEVLVGDGAEERETSLFDRLQWKLSYWDWSLVNEMRNSDEKIRRALLVFATYESLLFHRLLICIFRYLQQFSFLQI